MLFLFKQKTRTTKDGCYCLVRMSSGCRQDVQVSKHSLMPRASEQSERLSETDINGATANLCNKHIWIKNNKHIWIVKSTSSFGGVGISDNHQQST